MTFKALNGADVRRRLLLFILAKNKAQNNIWVLINLLLMFSYPNIIYFLGILVCAKNYMATYAVSAYFMNSYKAIHLKVILQSSSLPTYIS